jgi:putative transcriptional regulator
MKEESFSELVASVKEGGAILRGERKPSRSFHLSPLDISRIRENFDLTQVEFAALLGISVRTLRNWEQGRRVPDGAALVLLRVAEKHPEAVLDVIQAGYTMGIPGNV